LWDEWYEGKTIIEPLTHKKRLQRKMDKKERKTKTQERKMSKHIIQNNRHRKVR
jgi:hypothetical protein